MEIISGIYKVTNLINNKIYIGQSINIYKRWEAHKYVSLNKNSQEYNIYFHNALRKYGINNFLFEIIEQCNKDELDEKEKYWIEYYDSCNRDIGYNESKGGYGYNGERYHIEQYDLDGNFIKEWDSVYEAAKSLNTSITNIRCCILYPDEQKSAAGFQWKRKGDSRIITKYSPNYYLEGLEKGRKRKQIKQYNKNNEYVQTFESRKDAAYWLKENGYTKANDLKSVQGHLSTAINLNKLAYGFYWKDGD